MYRIFVTLLFILFSGVVLGQRPSQMVETVGGFCIPDPNSITSVFPLILNPSISAELQLPESQREAAEKLLASTNGSIDTFIYRGPVVPGEELERLAAEHKVRSRRIVDEILEPEKQARLKQLVYHVEIARVGYGEALVDGRLGHDIGVHENQKENLRLKAAQIEERVKVEIRAVLARAKKDLLAELTPKQRQDAEQRLGEPFAFRETTIATTMRSRSAVKDAPK